MPAKLPDMMKSLVIEQWLEGTSRDDIAANNNLSAGAVTNILNEWRRGLGLYIADELRYLSTTLRKVRITPAQCALGFRAAMVMINLGVKDENFESFILEVYSRSKDLGLSPDDLASHLKDLVGFSKTVPVSLSEIPNYIKLKTDEKRKLEAEIEALQDQVATIKQEKSHAEILRVTALRDKEITFAELKWYSDLKAELGKYGIAMDDTPRLAAIVNGIRQYGYEVDKVLEQFRDLNLLRAEQKLYQASVQDLESRINNLRQQQSLLEFNVDSYSQSISAHKELEVMGFGLKKLRLLYHIVNEIADANNINPVYAQSKFFKDVEEQYDNKLGFEPKIEQLRIEINQLNQQRNRLSTELLSLPFIGPTLIKLIQAGVKDDEIIKIAELVERYRNTSPSINSNRVGIDGDTFRGINVQMLISELEKYGSIKSAVQSLKHESDELSIKVNSLKTEREALEKYNQKMLYALAYSRQAVDFFQGTASSLRNEIAGLTSILAYIAKQLENMQSGEDQIREFDRIGEFKALTRAYNGDTVSMQELKNATSKAIEVVIAKILKETNNKDQDKDRNRTDNNKKLVVILSKARIALTD